MCCRETPTKDNIVDHSHVKAQLQYIEVMVKYGVEFGKSRTLNFCPSCAKKSYTIEDLKTVGNCNQWCY